VPTISLPDDPSLEHLRGQARALQRAADAGDPVARQRILAHKQGHDGDVPLSLAQSTLAREYGFASWPRLRHHLDVIARYRRDPEPEGDDPFCRLACLNYTQDGPDRWAQARALRPKNPESIWAAAVASPWRAPRAARTASPHWPTSRTPVSTRTSSYHRCWTRPGSCCAPVPTRTPATCGAG
jgi:hypothetical protein